MFFDLGKNVTHHNNILISPSYPRKVFGATSKGMDQDKSHQSETRCQSQTNIGMASIPIKLDHFITENYVVINYKIIMLFGIVTITMVSLL